MTRQPVRRRRLLAVAGASVASVAGCVQFAPTDSGQGGEPDDDESETETERNRTETGTERRETETGTERDESTNGEERAPPVSDANLESPDPPAIDSLDDSLNAQNGLAITADSIFYVDDEQIQVYDRAAERTTNSFDYPVDGKHWPRGLAYGGDSLWFSDAVEGGYTGEIAQLNPETGAIRGSIYTDYDPVGLAIGEGSLWVGDITSNRIVEYGPDGEELSSFSVYGEAGDWLGGLAYFDGSLWLGNGCGTSGCTVSLFEFDTDGKLLQETGQRSSESTTVYGGLATTESQLLGPDTGTDLTVLKTL